MVDFSKIKLVIWDLDDTFWNGIISEQNVFIEERNIELIKTLTDCGIINTICSKNDFEVVKNKLSETDLWDYFVFSSINWESKGIRVKQIIEDMCLRPANVLFIDDNDMNLNEALYFCPELMISSPDVINDLYMFAKSANKSDLQHKRLKQYKLLEKKQELRNEFSNNEEFLLSCNIQVVIKNDCMKCVDRLHELVMRSNQLNYTKNRQSIEDFTNLISDKSVNSGYVEVSDKFGDYGIVGFYAIKDNELIHFAFSCRTLGMKVEQWVYAQIGYPKLKVVAEVASALENNFSPSWINNIKLNSRSDQAVISDLILFKGSCDMLQLFTFIKKTPNIKTEFTYVNKLGQTMMGQNHTSQILTSLLCDDAKKNQIIAEVPFLDNNSLTTSIATIKYKYIFLSLLIDGTLGVYKRRESGECISELEDYYPLTYKENFNLYINQQIYTGNNIFTQESLQQFSSKYEYVDTSNAKITIENLKKIREIIPKETTLVLLLGPQTKFENNENKSYENKHVFNKLLIEKSKKLADEFENIKLIEFDKYIKSQSDFTNSPNHFAKRVYFDLANDIIKILDSEQTDYKKSKFEVAFSICISGIKSYLIKIKIIKKLSNLLLKK